MPHIVAAGAALAALRGSLLAALAVAAVGCDSGEDRVWQLFNSANDRLEIEVGVPDEAPPVEIDLYSSTRQHVIGRAVVDPGSGPFGTEHLLVVQVGNDFDPALEESAADNPIVQRVGRVSVEVDSGARGVQEWDLRQDTATPRTWVIELESLGAPGDDPRTDVFRIRLWESVLVEEVEAAE